MFCENRNLRAARAARQMLVVLGLGLLTVSCSLPPALSTASTAPVTAPLATKDTSPSAPISQEQSQGQLLPISAAADIKGTQIALEVAVTSAQRATGLMFRPEIPDNRGMLFPFDPAQPVRFWMRNVLVPLDMVFLRQGRVEAIAADVPPCEAVPCPTYGPGVAIDQVIELRGGRAAELGLQVGDRIAIDFTAQPIEAP